MAPGVHGNGCLGYLREESGFDIDSYAHHCYKEIGKKNLCSEADGRQSSDPKMKEGVGSSDVAAGYRAGAT